MIIEIMSPPAITSGLLFWAAVFIDDWYSCWALVGQEEIQAACIRWQTVAKPAYDRMCQLRFSNQ